SLRVAVRHHRSQRGDRRTLEEVEMRRRYLAAHRSYAAETVRTRVDPVSAHHTNLRGTPTYLMRIRRRRTTNDPEGSSPSAIDAISDVPSLMRSLNAPPVDAVAGWFGADLSGSRLMLTAVASRR